MNKRATAAWLFCAVLIWAGFWYCHRESHGQTLFDPAITMSDSPLRRGLVGYWRLEEASGTRYDCSKNGLHLTSNNSVGQTNGVQQNCATFVSASSQYLSRTNGPDLASGFTLAAWVWITTTNNTEANIIVKEAANYAYRIYIISDRFNVLCTTNGTTPITCVATNAGGPSAATWYFVVGRADNSAKTLSISVNNGTVDSKSIGTGNLLSNGSEPLNIGAANGLSKWNGRIDEAGIWNRPLTAAEITFLYQAGRGTHFPWAHP